MESLGRGRTPAESGHVIVGTVGTPFARPACHPGEQGGGYRTLKSGTGIAIFGRYKSLRSRISGQATLAGLRNHFPFSTPCLRRGHLSLIVKQPSVANVNEVM